MNNFVLDGKKYVRVANDEFTFRQYEAATPIIEKFYEFIATLPTDEPADDQAKIQSGVDVMKRLQELKLIIPLITILYLEEGQEYTDEYYRLTAEIFHKKLTMKIIKTVKEDLLNFLYGGPAFIMECSLYSSPAANLTADLSKATSAQNNAGNTE